MQYKIGKVVTCEVIYIFFKTEMVGLLKLKDVINCLKLNSENKIVKIK